MAWIPSNIFGLAGRSVTVPVDSLWAPREGDGPMALPGPAAPAIRPGRPQWADHELIAHGDGAAADGAAAVDLALLLGAQDDVRSDTAVPQVAVEGTAPAQAVIVSAVSEDAGDFAQVPLAAFQAADNARIDPHEAFTMLLPEQVAMDSGMFMIV
jgi:hypothetical protein